MVCIAAFIVLVILAASLPILRLFNAPTAESIWKNLKRAWGCVGRRITLRPCDTSFKQDIEHSILRRVIRKNPRLVRPVRITIEVVSVFIVLITVWSLLVVIKSGLSLYVYGTCDVNRPSACSLSQTEACTIDAVSPSGAVGEWFVEWGDLFAALPSRMKAWDAGEYIPQDGLSYAEVVGSTTAVDSLPVAVDIFDPGCIVCKQSFEAQRAAGFMEKYRVYLVPYSIKTADGYKFRNSELTSRYIEAVRGYSPSINEWVIIQKLFTEKMPGSYLDYQQAFNTELTSEEAEKEILHWLKEAGADDAMLRQFTDTAHSPAITERLERTRMRVDETIQAKYIPTMIYDGKRHDGLFKAQ